MTFSVQPGNTTQNEHCSGQLLMNSTCMHNNLSWRICFFFDAWANWSLNCGAHHLTAGCDPPALLSVSIPTIEKHTHTWKHIGILWHFWGLILSPNSGLTFCGLGLKNKAKKGCQKCDPKMGFKLFPFDGQKWEAKKGLKIYGKN